jgi:hypothetical protein
VAVLGDSFVWGDGLENLDDVWAHRLESKLVARYGDAVEVMSWGRRGWSTYRQLEFLQGPGSEFDFDYLIIGYVSNDPHIPKVSMPRRMFVWHKIMKRLVPLIDNVVLLVLPATSNFLYSLPYFKNWGYGGWKRALYSNQNMENYALVLEELRNHLYQRGIKFVFIITPTMQDIPFDDQFNALFMRFDQLGIPYVDLRPDVADAFGKYSSQQIRNELWANPANSHPGVLLHDLYAEKAYDYLARQNNCCIRKLPRIGDGR